MVEINYELNNDGVINLLEGFLVRCRIDYLEGVPDSKRDDAAEIETAIIGMFGIEKGGEIVNELKRQKRQINRKKIYNWCWRYDKARY